MLHVFLPPHNTPTDCSPYAAWRPASSGSQAVAAMLVVAWQHSVSVYAATLLQRRPAAQPAGAAGAAQQPAPAPLPPPTLLRSWSIGASGGSSGGVCGCFFLHSGPLVRVQRGSGGAQLYIGALLHAPACLLASPALVPAPLPCAQVVLSSQGETCTAVHVYRSDWYSAALAGAGSGGAGQAADAEESLVLRDWLVGSQVGSGRSCGLLPCSSQCRRRCCQALPAAPAPALAAASQSLTLVGSSFHQALGGFGDQALLLNSQGEVAGTTGWRAQSGRASRPAPRLLPPLLSCPPCPFPAQACA